MSALFSRGNIHPIVVCKLNFSDSCASVCTHARARTRTYEHFYVESRRKRISVRSLPRCVIRTDTRASVPRTHQRQITCTEWFNVTSLSSDCTLRGHKAQFNDPRDLVRRDRNEHFANPLFVQLEKQIAPSTTRSTLESESGQSVISNCANAKRASLIRRIYVRYEIVPRREEFYFVRREMCGWINRTYHEMWTSERPNWNYRNSVQVDLNSHKFWLTKNLINFVRS